MLTCEIELFWGIFFSTSTFPPLFPARAHGTLSFSCFRYVWVQPDTGHWASSRPPAAWTIIKVEQSTVMWDRASEVLETDKRRRRSGEGSRLVWDLLGIGSAASLVRCKWNLCGDWGFHCTSLLLPEPAEHVGMCSCRWGRFAVPCLAQLGLLSRYKPSQPCSSFSSSNFRVLFHV